MKRAVLCLLAATSLATGAPAFAQGQYGGGQGQFDRTINQRQGELDARIDAGVRNRTLTVAEAAQLRAEFAAIAATEARYRANGRGLTPAERADLDNRFDMLSRRIQVSRNDNDNRGGEQNVNQRQRDLDARIEAGIRDRTLTPAEAAQLRREFQDIARDEANYRANGRGLTQAERAALDSRFDALERRLRADRRDDDRRWTNLNQRQNQFNNRLNQAVRERRLSTRAAANLRNEFAYVARLERQYRLSPPGITPVERADLNTRFNRMEANFRASVNNTNGLEILFESLFGR